MHHKRPDVVTKEQLVMVVQEHEEQGGAVKDM